MPRKLRVIDARALLQNLSLKHKHNIRFLEIGGNDGKTNDPIFPFVKNYGWAGVVMEPQKQVFQNQLTKNYKNFNGIKLINAALDAQNQQKNIYKLSFANQRWATGIASFKKDNLQKFIDSGYVQQKAKEHNIQLPENEANWIKTETVRCLSFESVLHDSGCNDFEVVMVDTEGFDFEILKLIDFEKIDPKIVIYEKEHLNLADYLESLGYLRERGFRLFRERRDVIAVKSDYYKSMGILTRFRLWFNAFWRKL